VIGLLVFYYKKMGVMGLKLNNPDFPREIAKFCSPKRVLKKNKFGGRA